ncbi:hypothetical protein C8J57DRAFT_1716554 [Mycena rebaudengoi]|nr:hypothetical protein C8J57DRAFT_1716554 [Mycena rebaudengoi]
MAVPQLLERQLEKSGHPAYIYDGPDGELVSIRFAQYVRTVQAASAIIYRNMASLTVDNKSPVVGIFAVLDSISYCMMASAIMRLGLVPFCISPRNATASLANLLAETGAVAVYVSSDTAMQGVMAEAFAISGNTLPVFEALTFEKLQDNLTALPVPAILSLPMDGTAIILHSSGSTSIFSKPVYMSHRLLVHHAFGPHTGEDDYCGRVVAAHNLPNFHGLGICLATWPASSGMIIAVLRPTSPPTVATPENTLNGILTTKPNIIFSTLALIEIWSRSAIGLSAMQSAHRVVYAGATLDNGTGERLVSQGAGLCSAYGSCVFRRVPR